jgi:hypothetical protein
MWSAVHRTYIIAYKDINVVQAVLHAMCYNIQSTLSEFNIQYVCLCLCVRACVYSWLKVIMFIFIICPVASCGKRV